MESFINEIILDDVSLCDNLIEYYNNNIEYKSKGTTVAGESVGKVSTDVIVSLASQNPIIIMYLAEMINSMKMYLKKYDLLYVMELAIKEPFNLQHYAPNEGFFNWHCERTSNQSLQRGLVFMTYLNDVTDGGETEFFFQNIKVKPEKGKTLIWPTDFTHMHRGITSHSQDKYIATGWFNHYDAIDYKKILLK